MYICRMNPFVSIIIPFYGEADPALLQRALDSIRGQGMAEEEYEIIITDDAGRTTGGARNNGMRQARGEYLLFVDADDILLPRALPPCLTLLRQHSPDILRFGFRQIRRGTPPAPPPQPHVQPPTFTRYPSGPHYMLSTNFLGVVWAHLFRRDMLEAARLTFCETSLFEDEEFVAKAYYHARSMLVAPCQAYGYSCLPYGYNSLPDSRSLPDTALARSKKMDAFCFMLLRLKALHSSAQPNTLPEKALCRRIRFLTIDYIRRMRYDRCRINEINRRLSFIKHVGLLPLPHQAYGWKYRLTALLVNLYARLFLRRYKPLYPTCL